MSYKQNMKLNSVSHISFCTEKYDGSSKHFHLLEGSYPKPEFKKEGGRIHLHSWQAGTSLCTFKNEMMWHLLIFPINLKMNSTIIIHFFFFPIKWGTKDMPCIALKA